MYLSTYLVWLITRYADLLSARALTLKDFLKQRKCHSITGVNSIIKSFNPVREKNILFLISVKKNILFLNSVKKNNLILILAKKKITIQYKNHPPPPGLRMAGPLYLFQYNVIVALWIDHMDGTWCKTDPPKLYNLKLKFIS